MSPFNVISFTRQGITRETWANSITRSSCLQLSSLCHPAVRRHGKK